MEKLTIGERIMIYRTRAGLSKKAFAQMTDISVPMLTKYEKGKSIPDADTICKFAAVLEVTMNKLMNGFDDPNKDKYKSGILNKKN